MDYSTLYYSTAYSTCNKCILLRGSGFFIDLTGYCKYTGYHLNQELLLSQKKLWFQAV